MMFAARHPSEAAETTISYPSVNAPDFGARNDLPCRIVDGDLWFADSPADLERAKTLCAACPVRVECLRTALERAEPWGVWGGEIFQRGVVIAAKRPRGRPRKDAAA